VTENGIIAQCNCGALPPPESEETVIYANNTAEVQQAMENANGKTASRKAGWVFCFVGG
jgi:hypothetical protein